MGVTFLAPEGVYTSPAKLITKEITDNGTYSAADDNANGFSSVTVNVEGGGGTSWQTVFEGSVTTEEDDGAYVGRITSTRLSADSIKVTFNGTEYTCNKVTLDAGAVAYGGVGAGGYAPYSATGGGLWASVLRFPAFLFSGR